MRVGKALQLKDLISNSNIRDKSPKEVNRNVVYQSN